MGGQAHGVLIVEDDDLQRELMVELAERAGYETAAFARGEEALARLPDASTAVVVIDICLPGISGYEVCCEVRERCGPDLPILFVSGVRTEGFDRAGGLMIGADDYLAKPFAPDEFIGRLRSLVRRSTPTRVQPHPSLTDREDEVLSLLATGLAPVDVASELVISPKTVGNHIEHIYSKLGVHTRAQAVAAAFRRDVASRPDE